MTTEAKFIAGIGVITVILVIVGILILGRGKTQENQNQPVDQNILLSNTKHTIGNAEAPVKIVEFADFQCPACAAAHPIIKSAIEKNKDKVYFVYRHYPLTQQFLRGLLHYRYYV